MCEKEDNNTYLHLCEPVQQLTNQSSARDMVTD